MKNIVILTLLLLPAALWAGEGTSRFALVIGNSAYQGDAALANPANDAKDIGSKLSTLGWKVTQLLDGDRKAMNRTITEFRNQLAAAVNPTALLYYAGHGIQISGVNYLLPLRETFESADDVVNDAISLQTILDGFEAAQVVNSVIILDACRDNPFAKGKTRSFGGSRGLSALVTKPGSGGSAILYATAPGETAADGSGRNGLFTQTLLKYLDSDLSLQVLATRITGEVKKLTGGKQTPYSSLSLTEEFYFAAVPPAAPIQPTRVQTPIQTTAAPDQAGLKLQALKLERAQLLDRRQNAASGKSWADTLGLAGWSSAAVGLGLAGYSFVASDSALKDYNAATSQAGFDAARNQMNLLNALFKIGLGVGLAGLTTGTGALFLNPDEAALGRQIQDLDQKINTLEAAK